MLLEKVKIKRLFNHYETEINFSKGINVIIGENGSGKTSIIESIAIALYGSSFKQKKVMDIFYNFEPKPSFVHLKTSMFSVYRDIHEPKNDYMLISGKRITGRENITKEIESKFVNKHFFIHIVYSTQDRFFDLVEFTPKEREVFVNKALSLDYINDFLKEVTSNINVLKNKRVEIQFLIKRLEASKENRKVELIKEIKEISEKLKEVEILLKELEEQKLSIEAKHLLIEKDNWLKKYIELKRDLFAYINAKQEYENEQTILLELKEKRSLLSNEIKSLQEKINRFANILKEGKCIYCERPLKQSDYSKYEQLIEKIQMEQLEFSVLLNEVEEQIKNIEKKLSKLQSFINKINFYRIKGDMIKLRQKCLATPSRRELKLIANKHFTEDEIKIIKKLEEVKKLYDELKVKLEKANWELETLTRKDVKKEYAMLKNDINNLNNIIDKLTYFKKVVEDYNLAGELRWIALNQTGIEKIFDFFDLGKLSFNKSFEFFIDDIPLHLCSGSQKVSVALAIRIAFLNLNKVKFVIFDEPTIYMDKKRKEDLKKIIQTVVDKGLIEQVILITHDEMFKEIANTLIKVEKTKDGAVVKEIF